MFDIFLEPSELHGSIVRYPEFTYIQTTYLRELSNITQYYHNRVYAVKSNHFLSMLLNQLDIPIQYQTDRYVDVASTRATYVAEHMKMTSSVYAGKIFDGIFYGSGCKEILIMDDSYFNPYYAEYNWKRISAVRVLLHPKSDLGLLLPNGKPTSSDTGLAVISINIPLLALQYRAFLLNQLNRDDESGRLGVQHFIHMYVLPNMLYSHMDIVIMNRMMNLYYAAPMGVAYVKHPFNVLNYSKRIDRILLNIIDTLSDKKMLYEVLLLSIPGIVHQSMDVSLQLPDVALTRQIYWAMIMSRLSIMMYMIDLGGEKDIRLNMSSINALKRILKRFRSDNIVSTILPEGIRYDMLDIADKILDI